jgi:hypothetical protein
MLRDAVASTFSVIYGVHECPSKSNCKRFVNVLVEDFTYEIDTNGMNLKQKTRPNVVGFLLLYSIFHS